MNLGGHLKNYNILQCELFREFGIEKLVLCDIIEFNRICSLIAYSVKHIEYANEEELKNIKTIARNVIVEELKRYKGVI